MLFRSLDLATNSRKMGETFKGRREGPYRWQQSGRAKKHLQISPAKNHLIRGVILAFEIFSLSACSSRTGPPDARYVPAGDLLDIVKDFQRLAKEDTYRFPIPKAVTGINIMKATLVRLEDYEKNNSGKFTDIVQFNKALALERLREYEQAATLYRK